MSYTVNGLKTFLQHLLKFFYLLPTFFSMFIVTQDYLFLLNPQIVYCLYSHCWPSWPILPLINEPIASASYHLGLARSMSSRFVRSNRAHSGWVFPLSTNDWFEVAHEPYSALVIGGEDTFHSLFIRQSEKIIFFNQQ